MARFGRALRCSIFVGAVFLAGLGLGAKLGDRPDGVPAPSSRSQNPPVGASNQWGQHTPRKATAQPPASAQGPLRYSLYRTNVLTDFNPDVDAPLVHELAYIDPMANVVGAVEIGKRVYVAPFASIRGDLGQPIHVGHGSNLQDGVVIHALQTFAQGGPVAAHTYEVEGRAYAVYVGNRVSLAHQSQIHGPAWIEDDVFVGMQSLVFKAHVGAGCVIEPASTVIGVDIPAGRYIPAGSVITHQSAADQLPTITDSYALHDLNVSVVQINLDFAAAYSGR
jgi:carbonic anhydrase/acetyltransferase-like protein (isoleucine patch superfamily)